MITPSLCRPLCPELTAESRAWQELWTVFTGNWGLKSLPGLNSVLSFLSPWDWSIWFLLSQKLYACRAHDSYFWHHGFPFLPWCPFSPPYLGSWALRWVLWGLKSWCFSAALLDSWLLKRTWAFHFKPLTLHPTSDLECLSIVWENLGLPWRLWPKPEFKCHGEFCIFLELF